MEKGFSKCAQVSNNIDNIVFYGENIVDFIERDYRYLIDSTEKEEAKKLIIETYEMISHSSDLFTNLLLACNDKIISTIDDRYEIYSPKGREWYDIAITRGDMVITQPYKDLLTKEETITISKKVKDREGCVVALDISQSKINDMIEIEMEQDGPISVGFILNQDGIIVAHTNRNMIGISIFDETMENQSYIAPYIEEILNNSSGKVEFDKLGYSYSLVYTTTKSDWSVVYLVNEKMTKDITRVYEMQLIITFVLCFLFLNLSIIIYYAKKQKAISLKERAETAEIELHNYQKELKNIIKDKTENIKIQSEKLKQLNTSIIDHLAHLVEFRDLESGQHIRRIKEYTYLLTKKASELYPEDFGICMERIELLCRASALHDIGKIGIPDNILLKPGRLTKEEFEIMKTHTVIGDELAYKILEKYDPELAKLGHDICRFHHERVDGKGYPDGLMGDEIPVCAQIVGVADVYDALIEKRIYKNAFEHKVAIDMILNGECGKFSDKLMRCLLDIEKDFEKISMLYADKEI